MNDRLSLSKFAAPTVYAATAPGGQLLFETPALRGLAMARRAERGFLLKSYFFRSRAFYASDHSVVRILSFTQLSRAYSILTPALGCRAEPADALGSESC